MWIQKLANEGLLTATMVVFPIVYTLFSWSVLPLSGLLRVLVLILLVLIKVAISVSALQSCMIQITNSVTPPKLASANGANFALASVARGISSLSSGILFSYGVHHSLIALPFWTLSAWSLLGCITAQFIES